MRTAGKARLPLSCAILACLLGGCGTAARREPQSVPAYVREPFTSHQERIAAGARLFVVDGCEACHLNHSRRHLGPSFESFAGQRIRLADGRHVVIDEAVLRASMLDPAAFPLPGYRPAAMLLTDARLRLSRHPREVAELAAFIEEIGPETG